MKMLKITELKDGKVKLERKFHFPLTGYDISINIGWWQCGRERKKEYFHLHCIDRKLSYKYSILTIGVFHYTTLYT
jgi:hypothetical protein